MSMNSHALVQYSWRQIWQSHLKYLFVLTVISLVVFQQLNLQMLLYFQHRPLSITLYDPILRLIRVRPVNTEINILLYSSVALVFIYLLARPGLLLVVIHALLLMWLSRWLTIYLLPLAAPSGKLPLHDFITYSHYVISRDLFFSGHTATLVILLCTIKHRWLFVYTFTMTLTILSLLLIGHQHYLLDIVAAPFFAIICYHVSLRLNKFATLLLLQRCNKTLMFATIE